MRVSQPKVRHVVLWGIILFDKTLERRVAVATSFFASGWKMTPLCKKRICLVRLWQTIGKGKILWSRERKPKTWGRLPPRWEKVDKPAHLSFSCSLDLLLNQTNMRYRIRQFAVSRKGDVRYNEFNFYRLLSNHTWNQGWILFNDVLNTYICLLTFFSFSPRCVTSP